MRKRLFVLICRSLRKDEGLHFERVRADLRNFHAPGYPLLTQPAQAWVGLGKHLCGAATDFGLRCCLPHSTDPDTIRQSTLAPGASPAWAASESTMQQHGQRTGCESPASAVGGAGCGRSSPAGREQEPSAEADRTQKMQERELQQDVPRDQGGMAPNGLPSKAAGCRGVAIATCCHHRCSLHTQARQAAVLPPAHIVLFHPA